MKPQSRFPSPRRATRTTPTGFGSCPLIGAALGFLLIAAFPLRAVPPIRTGFTEHHLLDAWETDQGLPESSARQMVQTADGFLWFGTMGGLVRFDGAEFQTFTPANTPSLPSEGIIYLHLDSHHRLWVSTLEGVVVSEPGRYTTFHRESRWTGNYVRASAEQADVVAFSSFDGRVFRATPQAFTELPAPPGEAGQTIFVHVDRAGQIWCLRRGFYGRWTGTEWARSPSEAEAIADFRGAGTGRNRELIAYGSNWILRLDGDTVLSRTALPEPIPPAWQVTEDHAGVIWFPTWGSGLYSMSRDGKVGRLTTASGLLANSLRFVFEDVERNLWTGGGNGGGLIRLRARVVKTLGLESGLPERLVKAVAEESPGKILLGTYGQGLAQWENGRITTLPREVTAATGTYVQCLLVSSDGTTWIGTYGNGLHRKRGGELSAVAPGSSGGRNINGLFEDSRRRVWIGGSEGAFLYAGDEFVPQREIGGASLPALFAFAESPLDNAIWAANDQSLYRYDDRGWRQILDDAGRPISGIMALQAAANGDLWTGGVGGHLRRLRAGRWTQLGANHGLPSATITTIVDDGSGNWWLGSGQGLLRISKADLDAAASGERARVDYGWFTQADGLATLEIAGGFSSTALRDSGGRLWFATPRGVARIDPTDLHFNSRPPPVVLESITYIDGQENRHTLPGQSSGLIELPPGSRKLEVRFAVLSFRAPEKIKLRHRFLRNGELISDDLQKLRTFQSDLLVPGQYSLAMTAANDDGVWSSAATTLQFVVRPHFWQSTWFEVGGLFLLLSAGGAVGWTLDRNRTRRHRETLERERALAREHALLASVLEGTSDFVAFIAPDGRTTYLNPAGRRLAGLAEPEHESGMSLTDFFPAQSAELIRQTAVPHAVAHGTWRGEVALLRRDGREIPVSQVLVAHKGPSGELMFVSTILRDITEQKAAEHSIRELNATLEERVANRTLELAGRVAEVERLNRELETSKHEAVDNAARLETANAELRAANEELEAFSYSVSHDLRAPLRNISGFMELLAARASGRLDAEDQRFVQTVINEATRMGRLINDLLEFSRIGRTELSLQRVSLDDIVAAERASLDAGHAGRVIEWRIDPLPAVTADPTLLRVVFANLLGNAVKFTARRQRAIIEISRQPAQPGDPWVTVSVRDNGAGFDPRYTHKLFGVFQRLHTRKEFEGTGIGLANVYRIVTRLGGTVWAEGNVDKGAVFYLKFRLEPR